MDRRVIGMTLRVAGRRESVRMGLAIAVSRDRRARERRRG